MSDAEKFAPLVTAVVTPLSRTERRRGPRVKLSQPVRVRLTDSAPQEEIRSTLNLSVDSLHFTTWADHYYVGMRLRVTFPYSSWEKINGDYLAEVVRVEGLDDGRLGVVLRFLKPDLT